MFVFLETATIQTSTSTLLSKNNEKGEKTKTYISLTLNLICSFHAWQDVFCYNCMNIVLSDTL